MPSATSVNQVAYLLTISVAIQSVCFSKIFSINEGRPINENYFGKAQGLPDAVSFCLNWSPESRAYRLKVITNVE